jgi:predicted ribosome quality control (RQC) complex YloA/Tae2 family protein
LIGTRRDLPPTVEIPALTQYVATLRNVQEPVSPRLESSAAPGKPAGPAGHTGSSDITLQAAFKNGLSVVPPTVIRELLHRAGLPPVTTLQEMTAERWPMLSSAAAQLEQEFLTPRFLLVSNPGGLPLRFSTIRLLHALDASEEEFPDIHTALREFSVRKRSMEAFQHEHQRLRDLLRRRIEKTERTCDAIRTDVGETDRAATYRRYGSLLMEHLDAISKGVTTWALTEGGTTWEVPLQPSLTPVQNAQRYFEKAKSSDRSRMMTGDRLRVYGAVLTQARSLLSELESITTRGELKTFMKQQKELLRSLGAVESGQDQERAPFRIFTVHGGFEVWAGKSSANNDDLTLHHARPEDLWFHARGSSGSHVILKISSAAGEPGKRARQEAAGIAAYYSKMRTAKIVPVAMTRRKYVHKPKGSPPGTVVIAREEVLMATPGLPKEQVHKKEKENPDA